MPRSRPPSVDAVARWLAGTPGGTAEPWGELVEAAREGIARAGATARFDDAEALAAAALDRRRLSALAPVINATGVLLHTNLGRAPLVPHDGPAEPPRGVNVEYDLATGRRGSRRAHAEQLICGLTGAEAALVVNNCAAAVLLVLAALATGRDVVVSRGELVEIGGGFRVPEVLAQSGARLVEVGTTNRTRLSDYRAAIDDAGRDVALVLKVHQSNYRMVGFTEDVPVPELAGLGVPVVADIGSGLLDATTPWLPGDTRARVAELLRDEPAARQTLAGGAALVAFSGDKLLGGPQAGIVAGRRELVDRLARHPLTRALRPGTLVLSALDRTLRAYRSGDATSLPFWRMVTVPVTVLRDRAEMLRTRIDEVTGGGLRAVVVDTAATPGGGTLPGRTMPSVGVAIGGDLSAALRRHRPAVATIVRDGTTIADLRTVDPADDPALAAAIVLAWRTVSAGA